MDIPNTVLHIDDVHKSFAGLHALSDVDLDVREGETHAIIGPNGAGKSTLIRYLLGFYADECGHPFLAHWKHITPFSHQDIGYVPELPFLDEYLTGLETLHYIARLKAHDINLSKAESLVNKVGLKPQALQQPIRKYSKGMKQRLMLAQALIGNPKLLVLDEPLSGLDPFGHQEIMTLLTTLKEQQNCKLILSTHSLEDAFLLGDDLWLLQEGQFVYEGKKPNTIEALSELYFKYPPQLATH